MNTIDAIYARRSIRSYQERPVERDTVETLMKAAMAGPSAVNAQPWEFIVTDDEAQIAKIKQACEYGQYNTPMAIIVCGNMNYALSGRSQEYWIQENKNLLGVPAVIGVGGSFDVLSGEKEDLAWVRGTGFEWLFRTLQDPKRYLKRYFVINPWFTWKILQAKLKSS